MNLFQKILIVALSAIIAIGMVVLFTKCALLIVM